MRVKPILTPIQGRVTRAKAAECQMPTDLRPPAQLPLRENLQIDKVVPDKTQQISSKEKKQLFWTTSQPRRGNLGPEGNHEGSMGAPVDPLTPSRQTKFTPIMIGVAVGCKRAQPEPTRDTRGPPRDNTGSEKGSMGAPMDPPTGSERPTGALPGLTFTRNQGHQGVGLQPDAPRPAFRPRLLH